MLNRSERFKVLKTIQNCCKTGCFPVTVDLSTWRLRPQSRTGKPRWMSLAHCGCYVLHAVYIVVTFLLACRGNEKTPIHELTIHGLVALATPIISFWYYMMFTKNVATFGGYLQMTLTGNIVGNVFEERDNMKWTNRLKEYTIQDLVAIGLPYMIAPLVPAYIAAGIFYPNLQLLLYAGLPEQYQTWLSFSVLLLEEMRFLVMCCVVPVPMWTLQLISFDLVNTQLQVLINSIERVTKYGKFKLIYSSLRQIQLYVMIVNVVNRYLIFTWKVLCITASIVSGYCAIAHFEDYPLFGVLYYIILIDCTFIYIVMYSKAFKIQTLFEEATKNLLIRLHRRVYRDMRIVKRQIRSLPPVGIKVGEFHMMERQSIPTFVYYVLSNIVAMLVVYKH